jgi:hypothetical protein
LRISASCLTRAGSKGKPHHQLTSDPPTCTLGEAVPSNASYQKQLAEASKARADLEVRLKELQDNLKDSTTREDRLRDQLAKFAGSGRRFSMSQNQTEMLGNGHIIGVNAVYSTWLNVTFDNKEREMKAGSYISVDVPDKVCILTLVGFQRSPDRGEFDWACQAK